MLYKEKNIISSKNVHLGNRVELNLNSAQDLQKKAEDIQKQILLVESQHDQIVQKLELERTKMIEDSKSMSVQIEKDAYEKGYKEGQANGYEDGYKEAYEENIERARFESEAIIQEAQDMLIQANNHMNIYLKENKNNILKLAISIAEQVLREKFKDEDSMNNLIEKALSEFASKKSIVIKVNPLYKEEVERNISNWKEEYSIKDDLFVLASEKVTEGNVIIESEKGSIISGIDTVLEELKKDIK